MRTTPSGDRDQQLDSASALKLARAVRDGRTSCEALTAHYLARIAARNPELGALVEVWPARALRRAREIDRAIAAGRAPSGVFLGVPTAIKDTDPSRGAFLRFGSRAFAHLWSPVDGPVAARVRAGGFHIIGRSATSELALLPSIETDIHPPCRNPWAPRFSAGGSSGGAASAVGACLLPIAHASDAAGSIRIPASLCGVVGMKPSRGWMPNFYPGVDSHALCAVNCVARTVEDSAAFLDVMCGRQYDPRAPTADSFLAHALRHPRPARIRFCTTSPVSATAPEVIQAVAQAVELLRGLGHEVQAGPALDAELEEFLPIWQRMAANMPLPPFAPLQVTTRWLRTEGKRWSRREIAELTRRLTQRIETWFGDADLWITPTLAAHPPAIGHYRASSSDPQTQFQSLAWMGAFTAPFNLTGQPAVTIPLGTFNSGVPIGVQLVGRLRSDGELLAIARQLDARRVTT